MFEELVEAIKAYPYIGAAVLFVLCGLGFPLPEELVLLAGGYVCYNWPERANLPVMMGWCAGAILVGDLIPCVLGRVFGVRLLRLRWLRHLITKQRLAKFDGWFRKRGDLVILIARFLPGIRVVAFFTAGTMKMPWRRFLFLDGLGIALIVPLLTWLGYHSATFIDRMVALVERAERGILWGALTAIVLGGAWFWLWRRRHRKQPQQPTEAFVQPQLPVQESPAAPLLEPLPPSLPNEPSPAADPSRADDGTPPTTAESDSETSRLPPQGPHG
jgi:membrane protein DedA with SNARE-associated domain